MSPLIGLVGAWVFIIIGMILKGGTIAGIISIPALFMVGGGTACILITSFGMKEWISMIKLTILSLKERADNRPEIIKTLVGFSEKARREGLLVLEEDAKQVEDPFLGKGVRLVVDGTDPELVKDILETELDAMEERHHKNQDMFKQGGAFAPTVGILATVLSLVGVLQHLDHPDTLGPAISAAFLATFYGVAAANVILLPIANALKKMSMIEAGERLLMIEGVLSIQSGDNPRILAEKLWSFLPPDQRENTDDAEAAGAGAGAGAGAAEPAAQAA